MVANIRARKRLHASSIRSTQKSSGTVVALPVVNVPAFQARVAYVCPIDGINLNRVFPGDPAGSISHRIAHTVFDEVISKADYLIDIHGGDLPEELAPQGYVLLQKTQEEKVDRMSRCLADLFEAEYIVDAHLEGTCIGEAGKIGIPAISPEMGGEGKLDERAVRFYVDGILNTMKYLNMTPGAVEQTSRKQEIVRLHLIRSRQGGVFYPSIKAGDMVSRREGVGQIKNITGEVLEEIIAPAKGVIVLRITHVTVNSGDLLMILGEL